VLCLHFPIRQLTDKQWELWANSYHQVLGHVPDEVFVDACTEWLATQEKMPTPAGLAKVANDLLNWRKIWITNCNEGPKALARWDDDHTPRLPPAASAKSEAA